MGSAWGPDQVVPRRSVGWRAGPGRRPAARCPLREPGRAPEERQALTIPAAAAAAGAAAAVDAAEVAGVVGAVAAGAAAAAAVEAAAAADVEAAAGSEVWGRPGPGPWGRGSDSGPCRAAESGNHGGRLGHRLLRVCGSRHRHRHDSGTDPETCP